QDSGFSQTSIHARSTWMPTDRSSVSAAFIHSDLHNVRAYNNLLGGLGRLQATFEPQRLNLLYLRYERLAFGWLDSISGTFSVNSQHDGAVRQGLRVSDPAIVDNNRADVFGYTAQAAAGSTVFGAELYAERIRSERSEGVIARRPLYPDDSAYRTTSAFVQHSRQLLRNRIRLQAGGRVTAVRYRTDEAPVFGVTQSRQTFRDATFNASAGWQVSRWIALNLLVGRGFRAPNSNDLGAVGLNDLGYEIPASEATGLGAVLSNSAGEGATSLGRPVADLRPERLWNYEAGIRIAAKRLHARAQFYDFELLDPIVRRTLLFPADAVPSALGGLAVRAIAQTPEQRVQNVVAVAAAIDPRGMKAFVNDGHARYYGVDSTLEWRLNPRAHLRTSYSYITGRELNPNRRVRRLPPQNGSGSLHVPLLRRLWMETSVLFAGPQSRLSGGDLDDERIGASRSLRDISDFFASSRTSVYLQGVVFGPTGETLAEIQGRVLPGISSAAARVPLYSRTAGWVDASVRGGFLLRESLMLNASWTNMLDKNYRVHGSGVDSPGRSVFLGFTYQF
ncbi:MAG TPA: TonB-dependent receptor, partial [Bryobacteraceae bacterium]|nr:TonB-dependent receptor [Bryobacteraceae bacterium]